MFTVSSAVETGTRVLVLSTICYQLKMLNVTFSKSALSRISVYKFYRRFQEDSENFEND